MRQRNKVIKVLSAFLIAVVCAFADPGFASVWDSGKRLIGIEAFIGVDLSNSQDQTLGRVHDILIDENLDAAYYIVIESEDKLYPVPLAAFDFSSERPTLNLTVAYFRGAPTTVSFGDDNETLSSSEFRQKVRAYYSNQVSKNNDHFKSLQWMDNIFSSQNPALLRCSELIGLDVRNLPGQHLGDIENLLLDMENANIAYSIVSFGGVWGIGEKNAAVPWNSFDFKPELGIAKLNSDMQTLSAAQVETDEIERLSETEFARQIHENFGTEPYWEIFAFAPGGSKADSYQPWAENSRYNRNFDKETLTVISGIIKSVGTFYPEINAAKGLRLKISSQEGLPLTVYAGPASFAQKQKFKFKPGDKVTVTGSKILVNDRSVIMASKIETQNKTLILRDATGKVEWKVSELNEEQKN